MIAATPLANHAPVIRASDAAPRSGTIRHRRPAGGHAGLTHPRPQRSPVTCRATGDPTMDLTINEERWKQQVRSGKIRNVSAEDAGQLIKEGWTLLDVRPPFEADKVPVVGAVAVPMFVMDPDTSMSGMLKQATAFGMGGWWLGGGHTIPNTEFMQQVQQQLPNKDQGVIIACQKGLRSLAAAEQLVRAGYTQVGWIAGGLDTAKASALPTPENKDLRYAGIGGLSEALGWTEVQQENSPSNGPSLVLKLAAVVLAADLLLFAVEQVSYMLKQQ